MSDHSAHYPSAAEAGFARTSPGLRQNGASTLTPANPLLPRLCEIRTRLSAISGDLIRFQAKLNGDPPDAHIKDNSPGYPPCSVEDVLSQIEQHIVDIENQQCRIGARF